MNKVFLSGFAAADPIIHYTSNSTIVMHFSLAVRKGKKKEGEDRDANFYEIEAWGKTAEIGRDRIMKGTFLFLIGRLDNDTYEKAGQKMTRTKIVAEYIEYPPIGIGKEGKEETISEEVAMQLEPIMEEGKQEQQSVAAQQMATQPQQTVPQPQPAAQQPAIQQTVFPTQPQPQPMVQPMTGATESMAMPQPAANASVASSLPVATATPAPTVDYVSDEEIPF